MLKKMIRWMVFVVVCLATLVALVENIYSWRARRAWEAYQRDARARGVKFTMAEVAPPPVPDDQNFASLPMIAVLFDRARSNEAARVRAIGLPRPDEDRRAPDWGTGWREGHSLDLAAWATYFTGQSNTASAARDVLAGLASREPALREIAEYARRPSARFPVQWDQGLAALLPHLNALRNWSRTFTLRACAELAAGDTAGGLEDTLTNLRLAETLKDEPILISALVRIVIIEQALQPVWEGLNARAWSDADLERLAAALGEVDVLASGQLAMQGERAMGTTAGVAVPSDPKVQRFLLDSEGAGRWLFRVTPMGIWFNGLIRLNRGYDYLDQIVDLRRRQVMPAAGRAFKAYETAMEKNSPFTHPEDILARLLLPALDTAFKRVALSQTTVDEARVACALERYRLAHGEYPAELAALVPPFLATLPHDVIGGGPLHYARTADRRFRLWSIGWNERDDGGTVVMTKDRKPRIDLDQGDWVWQYPAANSTPP